MRARPHGARKNGGLIAPARLALSTARNQRQARNLLTMRFAPACVDLDTQIDLSAVLVEGERSETGVLARAAAACGMAFESVAEPQLAVQRALEPDVGLVLIDFSRAGLDGYGIHALIRSHEYSRRNRAVAVFALTQTAALQDRARLFSLGFAGCAARTAPEAELQAGLALARDATSRYENGIARLDAGATDPAILDEALRPFGGLDAKSVVSMTLALEGRFTELLFQILLARYGASKHEVKSLADQLCALASWAKLRQLLERSDAIRECLEGDLRGFELSVAVARMELDRAIADLHRAVRWRPSI